MKSSTIWTIVGIVVLIGILYFGNKTNWWGLNLPANTTNTTARTTQKDYCERHGGTWDGEKCIAYADPNRIIIVKQPIIPISVNPAGGRPGYQK